MRGLVRDVISYCVVYSIVWYRSVKPYYTILCSVLEAVICVKQV